MTTVRIKLGVGIREVSDTTLAKLKVRADDGILLAEFGVPRLYDGASMREKIERYAKVLLDRVCARITNIERGEDGFIYGDVEAHGPLSRIVSQTIDSGRGENLIFSIRVISRGAEKEAITYDLVKF